MKIIKKGTVISFVCESCGCKFVIGIHGIVETDSNDENYYTDCPICGARCHADANARDYTGETPEPER